MSFMSDKVVKISERAEPFKETRNNRLLEIIEDYTELVADLIDTKGQARICDLAREMGISHVSVIKSVKRLIRDEYLTKDTQQLINLTSKGREVAMFAKKKHLI